MAKVVDYPRAALKSSILLAKGIDDLGGSCKLESAAESLGKKGGGAFAALVSAAVKYGFVENKKGQLSVTPLYRNYKLAYNKSEQDQVAQGAFLRVPLFREIYERFRGQKIPVDHFEKLLIREFDVPEVMSSRVARYFIEGAKLIGLLNADNTFSRPSDAQQVDDDTAATGDSDEADGRDDQDGKVDRGDSSGKRRGQEFGKERSFTIRVAGPGMDTVIAVNDKEDLQIVHAILKKVDRELAEQKTISDSEGKENDE